MLKVYKMLKMLTFLYGWHGLSVFGIYLPLYHVLDICHIDNPAKYVHHYSYYKKYKAGLLIEWYTVSRYVGCISIIGVVQS